MALRQVRMPSDYRPGRLAQGSTTRAGVSSVRLNCVDTVLTSTSIVDLRIRCSRSLSLPVPYLCVSRVVLNLKRSRACVSKTLASWADEYGTGSDSDRRQFRFVQLIKDGLILLRRAIADEWRTVHRRLT